MRILACCITAFSPATRSGWRALSGVTGGIWWLKRAARSNACKKALIERNVQLSNVLSDLSGMRIIGAIRKGQRAPAQLAALVEPEGKATPEDIAKSLEGIAECDLQLRDHLASLGSKGDLKTQPIGPKPKGKRGSRNAPQFALRTECIALPESTVRQSTAWMY
jgi:hypothetical protein